MREGGVNIIIFSKLPYSLGMGSSPLKLHSLPVRHLRTCLTLAKSLLEPIRPDILETLRGRVLLLHLAKSANASQFT